MIKELICPICLNVFAVRDYPTDWTPEQIIEDEKMHSCGNPICQKQHEDKENVDASN